MEGLVQRLQESVTVRRVFSEPHTQDGVTVIPAAVVAGGGGGGGDGQGGEGGGYGVSARPAGAYVIRDGEVEWRPAIDVNGAITRATVVAVVLLLVRWRVARIRARAR